MTLSHFGLLGATYGRVSGLVVMFLRLPDNMKKTLHFQILETTCYGQTDEPTDIKRFICKSFNSEGDQHLGNLAIVGQLIEIVFS